MSQLLPDEVEKKLEDKLLALLGILTLLFSIGIFVKKEAAILTFQKEVNAQITKATTPPPLADLLPSKKPKKK